MIEGDAFVLQPLWDWARSLPYANHLLFPSLIALGSFHFHCWMFTLYDGLVLKRRGVATMLWECALPQTLAHAFLNTVSFMAFHAQRELPEKAPSVNDFVFGLLMCYFVGDFLIYWEHVFMHKNKWLRHYVHATHHKYTSPMFSFNAGWVHPLEILVAAICELFYPTVASVHPLTLWVFLWTWIFWLTEEHSGDHVWFSLWNLSPLIGGGAPPHDLHHSPHLTKNFGFVFSCWDRLFGTFAEPSTETMVINEKQSKKDK